MARFHDLTVTEIRKTIRDAVVITLAPDPAAAALFDFISGQYLTFRRQFDGVELRRSYSICAGHDDGLLQVAIKRVASGTFSTWANTELRVGDKLQAMPPMGNFHTPLQADADKSYLAFAGGSGITPVLSILKTTLAREKKSRFTLVYANKTINSIMFREELEDLKNIYLGRLSVIHILETDTQEIDLFTGLVTPEKCNELFRLWIDVDTVDTAFICGPEPMMLGIAKALGAHGLSKSQIKFELFSSGQPGRIQRTTEDIPRPRDPAQQKTEAVVTLDGTERRFSMPQNGQTVLEAAIENHMDAPFSCRAGVCSTCRAKVLEGEVEMRANHALEDYEVAEGYVLTCQCVPIGARLVVDYDQ